ncbi:hypothetical protein AMATHDRAFT_136887 [Amanita thiersii Skay4041]|uniref:Phospholipid:diacylglycerol acyltransferase n=1 Tax=Amanita thiersii Skay4041 TaxID=703135 RepID=A0A2A9P003_9AGAR|nr:hypothetical protein AMATHDRAFT_136887 [Amanita thiersii Skay4041]
MSLLLEQYDFSLPEIPGVDFSRVEAEWARLRSNIPEIWKLNNDGREFEVGERMKQRGLTAEHPVILIPGVISTGLESWSTSPEYRQFFRQKLWGGFNMLSQVTFNKEKWIAAMMLDPVTGLDPPGVKIRAAEGIDAASMFIHGYWIWYSIVENLAVVNYDTNNLYLAAYDWRLSYSNLEERDGYFSKLKITIEGLKRRQGKKVVIAAHSMGSTVCYYSMMLVVFADLYVISFKWVESPMHGNGGQNWVEDHVAAYISIAGTHLAKAMAAFLSGEMKDTVQMNPAGSYVLERFFSRRERQKLFRSWAGSASMWLKVCVSAALSQGEFWGNATSAPDDEVNSTYTHGILLAFRDPPTAVQGMDRDNVMNMTADDASVWILQHTPATFQRMLGTNYSWGIEKNEQVLEKNDMDPTKWTNPLEVRLPNAPSMKMYCVYGHGKDTEVGIHVVGGYEYEEAGLDGPSLGCHDPNTDDYSTHRTPLDMPLTRRNWIDADFTHETTRPKVHCLQQVRNGVNIGEGDGTVSLSSLGAMCVEGWKRPRWNPAGIKITTVELPHRPVFSMPRGGANTSDHVDILGSTGLNEIILKVATGVGEEIQDTFVSHIREYAKNIQWD